MWASFSGQMTVMTAMPATGIGSRPTVKKSGFPEELSGQS
jgi:hypothetical protein